MKVISDTWNCNVNKACFQTRKQYLDCLQSFWLMHNLQNVKQQIYFPGFMKHFLQDNNVPAQHSFETLWKTVWQKIALIMKLYFRGKMTQNSKVYVVKLFQKDIFDRRCSLWVLLSEPTTFLQIPGSLKVLCALLGVPLVVLQNFYFFTKHLKVMLLYFSNTSKKLRNRNSAHKNSRKIKKIFRLSLIYLGQICHITD